MKILVTGGTGYIGSHTVVELLNNNYDGEFDFDKIFKEKMLLLYNNKEEE